jgi:hypothetical protein
MAGRASAYSMVLELLEEAVFDGPKAALSLRRQIRLGGRGRGDDALEIRHALK